MDEVIQSLNNWGQSNWTKLSGSFSLCYKQFHASVIIFWNLFFFACVTFVCINAVCQIVESLVGLAAISWLFTLSLTTVSYGNTDLGGSFFITFDTVDEMLWCDYSNETLSAVLLRGTIKYLSILQNEINFGIRLEFWFYDSNGIERFKTILNKVVIKVHWLAFDLCLQWRWWWLLWWWWHDLKGMDMEINTLSHDVVPHSSLLASTCQSGRTVL